jgi:hypothetical protein
MGPYKLARINFKNIAPRSFDKSMVRTVTKFANARFDKNVGPKQEARIEK